MGRRGRVEYMKRYVDSLACIFPFEKNIFESLGYKKAHYVGHPLAEGFEEKALSDEGKAKFLYTHGINPANKPVALLPGSRAKEVSRLWPEMLDAFRGFRKNHPGAQALVPLAPSLIRAGFFEELKSLKKEGIFPIQGKSLAVMQCARAGLLKSGTSNLQAAFCELPFTMCYKTGLLSEITAKSLVKLSSYSMVNIINPGSVNELLQREANALSMETELVELYNETPAREGTLQMLRQVKELLVSAEPSSLFEDCHNYAERVAALGLSLIN
jgi:lipid-A-disaccharide synthase